MSVFRMVSHLYFVSAGLVAEDGVVRDAKRNSSLDFSGAAAYRLVRAVFLLFRHLQRLLVFVEVDLHRLPRPILKSILQFTRDIAHRRGCRHVFVGLFGQQRRIFFFKFAGRR